MAIGVVKNESSLALVEEVTEGTWVAPSGAADFVELKSDGASANLERDQLSRDLLSSTVETESSRLGLKNVTAEMGFELRANSTAGGSPVDLNLPLNSLLGGKRTAVTDTTTTGNTSTILEFGAAPPFSKGDSVLVKEAGAYEVRPISAVGATTITFPFALDNGAPSDGVVVEAVTTYFHDTSSAVSLSAEWNMGGKIQEQISGLKAASGSIADWGVGSLPSFNFSMQGTDLDRVVSAATASPAANSALPPVTLDACAWLSGVKLEYSEFSMTIENTLAAINSACSENGRISSRITAQSVTASINPYLEDDDVDRFTDFNLNNDVSLFVYAFNPTAVAGEFEQAVAIWLPQGKITADPAADVEGIFADGLEIKAHRSAGNDSVFLSFI